jgi:hypothetical protein
MPAFCEHTNRTLHPNENGVWKNWDCLIEQGKDPEEEMQKALEDDKSINPIKWYQDWKRKKTLDVECGRYTKTPF